MCRLAEGRKLEGADVVQLVEGFIKDPWDGGGNPVVKPLVLIAGLKPGCHISGNDLLHLMQLCAKKQ